MCVFVPFCTLSRTFVSIRSVALGRGVSCRLGTFLARSRIPREYVDFAAAFVREQIVDQATGQDAVQKLFAVYGPKYQDRQGGYTRVLRLANRRGDNAPMAIISFVD